MNKDLNRKILTQSTYEELLATIATLQQEVASLRSELAAAHAQIAELKAQVSQNSSNSSKPPSTDPLGTARPKKKGRGRKRRKRGGQSGHEAKFMKTPEHVDEVHEYKATKCQHCHADLKNGELTGSCVNHYVYELPEIQPIIHDYQCLDVACPHCGLVTPASLPSNIPTGNYAPSTQAMVGLLRGEMRQSMRQCSLIMTNVLHIPMSVGMVAKTQRLVSDALATGHQEALEYIHALGENDRVFADETGWRQEKKKAWLWVAVAGMVTLFLVRLQRSTASAKDLLGESFRGVLTSDRYGAYNWISPTARQLCWSHLIRDFESFLDYRDDEIRIGKALLAQTQKMFRLWHHARDDTLCRAEFQLAMKPVRRKIIALLEEGLGVSSAKVRGKCKKILKQCESLFTFVDTVGVAPTNNVAERAVRFAVLWRKGSFGSDSENGARFAERILTVRATLRCQNGDLYEYLKSACAAFLEGLPAPALLPIINNALLAAA